VAATSFDYKRVDADVGRVVAFGTAGFERQFRDAMGPNFVGGITGNKTISVGDVVAGPRLQGRSGGQSTFLVIVDQSVSSEGSQNAPQIVHEGLLVTVLDKDRKVSNVQVL
jgi:hypothetical protein